MGARLFLPRPATAGPAAATPAVHRPYGRLREAAALLLVAGALFLVLALVSCTVTPGATEEVSSWVGPTGGYVAHFLAQGFGVAAWLAPLELSLIAIPLFRGRPTGDLWLRIAGDLTLAVVAAALAQVAAAGAVVFGHAPVGGNVGLLFGELMRELFSSVGSFLVGSTIVGLILIGRASFSFIEACRRTLALLERLAARLNALGGRLRAAWREARQLRRAEVERAPRIEPCDPDEAILLHLTDDDDSDWIPVEQTGAPPLALSQALKNARGPEFEGLVFATPEAPLVAALAAEPSESALAAPSGEARTEARARSRGRRQKDGAAGDDVDAKSETNGEAKSAAKSEGKAKSNGAKTPPASDDSTPAASNRVPAPNGAAATNGASPGAKKEPVIVDTLPEREVERPKAKSPVPRRGEFQLPASALFDPPSETRVEVDRDAILEHARRLEKTLADYGVSGKVEEVRPGPTVTMYEVAFEAGTRVSKVASLADDLALGLSRKVRIIAPIPGKSLIGFELPNDERQPVCLRELIEDQRFEKLSERAPLPVVLGRDIVGAPFYADLASMPHVIVAGATGAGKSVGLNVMLSSLLLKRTPEDLRLLMIDPKVVELAPFDGIPHLLLPVVTDMKQASTALRWAVEEMERRYQLFADAGTKNIGTYNAWVKRVQDGDIPAPIPTEVEALTADGALVTVPAAKDGNDGRPLPAKIPYIVIVVDEFADLMMQQGKEVEAAVARLAQKARAAGMHVVLATQRPSVDVITGTIKANFPTRIAFRVSQRVDSKTILDEQGAELLLGRGDMLVKLNGSTDTRRAQCPFVSEEEVERLTDHLRKQGSPQYHEAILLTPDEDGERQEDEEEVDARFDEAVRIVAETQRCSTSWLQRKMTIGYNRAAKIVEMMERRGMVGPPNGSRDRDVLMSPL
jgi:S-DNA-T family DNA segregation ATPase FtsK/SpoIIIE